MAALTHILALLTWIIGSLTVLLVADDEFVEQNARNALDWQIFLTISGTLIVVVVGLFLLLLLGLLDLIFCVLAAVKATNNEAWKYPLMTDLV